MTWTGLLSQLLEIVIAVALAPLLSGWVNQWRAWLQNRSAPSLLQPYRMLHKLFNKESVVADNASPLFRTAPYVVFGCMALACAIIPTLSTDLPLAPAADAIALVGLFALARVFISLAAMDIGTAFGSMGARREMLIGFLAEPALLMVLFSASLISKSTSLTTIVETLAHREFAIYPGLAFAGVAFTMVSLAENARVPVDNPATHLELTMIHEALILEYSGRHLALIEWAASLKLFAYSCIGLALFLPWGVAEAQAPVVMLLALPVLVLKLAVGGFLLALLETLNAKMRIFRVPEFLATAFLLAVIGLLVHLLLAHDMTELLTQFVNLLGAVLLMLAFAMIGAAPHPVADPPVHPAGRDAGAGHRGGRLRHEPAPPLPVGRHHLRAQGAADSLAAAPRGRPPGHPLGGRDADQHPDHHADRHRRGDLLVQPGLPISQLSTTLASGTLGIAWPACCCRS
jgi:formate hydrogenlyase subunit 4